MLAADCSCSQYIEVCNFKLVATDCSWLQDIGVCNLKLVATVLNCLKLIANGCWSETTFQSENCYKKKIELVSRYSRGIILGTWTWNVGFLDSRKSKVSEEEFLQVSKSEVLGIRDPAFKQNVYFFIFFQFFLFTNFWKILKKNLWRPNCRNQLGLLIQAFIVFWKWPNLYLNDRIQMKINHNWYFKMPQNWGPNFPKIWKMEICERKYQNFQITPQLKKWFSKLFSTFQDDRNHFRPSAGDKRPLGM